MLPRGICCALFLWHSSSCGGQTSRLPTPCALCLLAPCPPATQTAACRVGRCCSLCPSTGCRRSKNGGSSRPRRQHLWQMGHTQAATASASPACCSWLLLPIAAGLLSSRHSSACSAMSCQERHSKWPRVPCAMSMKAGRSQEHCGREVAKASRGLLVD